jgi:hypothetical protein
MPIKFFYFNIEIILILKGLKRRASWKTILKFGDCVRRFVFLNGFSADVIIGHNTKKVSELINEIKHFERVENWNKW